MLTSLKIWNEPNNLSHWDFHLDPGWEIYATMVRRTIQAVRRADPELPVVLGGLSPIDADFLRRMREQDALDGIAALGVHGFPYDWNLWPAERFPERIASVRREFGLPVWVTETGVSSFPGEAIAAWGLRRLREILRGQRVYWYTLLDLPPRFKATTRHQEAEGCAYWRHFHFGLLRHDGTPKKCLQDFTPEFGVCQWYNFQDERTLERSVRWLERLGVERVRTGLSWAESRLEGGWEWLDTIMEALSSFEVCATLCFTPSGCGLTDDHTSPPREVDGFVRFAERVARRYGTAASIEGRDDGSSAARTGRSRVASG